MVTPVNVMVTSSVDMVPTVFVKINSLLVVVVTFVVCMLSPVFDMVGKW